MRCAEKGGSLELSLLADVLSVSILKRKNHYSFVGSCLVSTVFSSRAISTDRTNQQPQSGSGALVIAEEEDLVVNKVPLKECCSKFQQY